MLFFCGPLGYKQVDFLNSVIRFDLIDILGIIALSYHKLGNQKGANVISPITIDRSCAEEPGGTDP
jgi:hypothetical protein